ncbi:uncharacterized protein LOC128556437 [Mercenaria mercenaria]|uniref:uncharacterized protein LOC128556437 n=1 Tax=Mercenaria mercenaria TaxID=6596 RepID=UPI00234F1D41|nr:uncharacterized protein LOC128556437 [Mercenaria mercenaria]XP_053397590.1 uncharacterized protein LOC128556437 [Mercenaria mercenaria]
MAADKYYNIETKLSKLKELCQEIIERYGTVSDIVKILINEYLFQPEIKQHIKEASQIFSTIDSEKQKCDRLMSLVIKTIETFEIKKSDITHINSTVKLEAVPTYINHVPKEEETSVSTQTIDEFRKNNSSVLFALCGRGNDFDSTLSYFDSLGDKQNISKSNIDMCEVIKSLTYTKDCKVQEKMPIESSSILLPRFTNLKIGNLSELDKIKRLKDICDSIHKIKDDKLNSSHRHRMETENPVRVNFRLRDDATHRESKMYRTFNAILRNNIRDYSGHGNCRPTGNVLHSQIYTEVNEEIDLYSYDSGDMIVMPNDIEGNQEQLSELIQFMKLSNKNTFDVQIQQSLGLQSMGDNESYELVVDITINQSSRKPLKKRFSFRMHVVKSEMFENALRDCQIYSLELTYTNIFPSDCRMFIALPIYGDGYLDRKDRLDTH